MDLYQELLANKHLSFDDEHIKLLFASLQSDYRFELKGSLLINFKCRKDGIYGMITNYKLILIIGRAVMAYRYNGPESLIDELDKAVNQNWFEINYYIFIYMKNNNNLTNYYYNITFASLLPVMTKRAIN